MIDFYQDSFDSRLLGLAAHKLIFKAGGVPADQVEQKIAGIDKPSMVCCFTPFDPSNIELLHHSGFRFISTKNIYIKDLNTFKVDHRLFLGGFKLLRLSMGEISGKNLDFTRMVSTIAPKGRYAKDMLIPAEIPLLVYREWINNSIRHAFADEVIILLSGTAVAGMITLKLRNGRGTIDLIIVDPLYQGKGIGKILLYEAQKYFLASDISELLVETEGENVNSNIFYQRNGFVLHDFQLVFHKHHI